MTNSVDISEFPSEQYPYKIRNWNKFQHYKKRNPPWIKLHISMLSSEDWVVLDDASKLLAMVCMLIASKHEGHIPATATPAYFKRVAYLDKLPNLKPLIDCGFLTQTLAHASNGFQVLSTARPETETETETETDKIKIPAKIDGQPRKGVKTRISDDWKPSSISISDAASLGFNETEVQLEAKKFRNHAKQNERTVVRWDSAFDNWLIKAAEFSNKAPPGPKVEVFPAPPGSPEFQAWKTFWRDSKNPRDAVLIRELNQRELEGRPFKFETQWPPGFRRELV